MALISYCHPWNVLGGLQNELRLPEAGCWRPAVDVREEKDSFRIAADLPGVRPDDVDITVEGSYITLCGSRNEENSSAGGGYHRVERLHGNFCRKFSLPESADLDSVKAESKDGVLLITVPKQEKELPRRIKVSN